MFDEPPVTVPAGPPPVAAGPGPGPDDTLRVGELNARIRRALTRALPGEVWVRGDSKLLHIYTLLMRQIAVHTLVEPDRFATDQVHVHPHKRNAIERGANYLLERCKLIGPHSGAWAEAMYGNRGPMGMRVLQGLLHLARRHPADQLEQASATAHRHGCWRLRDLRRLMEQGDKVVQIDFLQEHELIRDLSAYRIDGFTNLP